MTPSFWLRKISWTTHFSSASRSLKELTLAPLFSSEGQTISRTSLVLPRCTPSSRAHRCHQTSPSF